MNMRYPDLEPEEMEKTARIPWRRRLVSVTWGAGIGLGVGGLLACVWALSGELSLELSVFIFATGLALAGAVVGFVRRIPMFVGSLFGYMILSCWSVVPTGLKPGIGLWLVASGGGLVGGWTVGALFSLLKRDNIV